MWHFVYILKNQQGKQYVGHTRTMDNRLRDHNDGTVPATKMGRPWRIEWFCGFRTTQQAVAFERHLKGGSGSAFRFRHFVPKGSSA
jgi:putative endonuclease